MFVPFLNPFEGLSAGQDSHKSSAVGQCGSEKLARYVVTARSSQKIVFGEFSLRGIHVLLRSNHNNDAVQTVLTIIITQPA